MSNFKKTYNNQFVCDFETLHKDTNYFKNLKEKDTRIVYWYSQHLNNPNINFEGISGSDFYEWIISLKKDTTIWFHNLAFDGTYIVPILEQNGWKVVHADIVNDSLTITNGLKDDGTLKSRYFKVFLNGNRIYEIKMYHKRRINGVPVKTNIQIRCSYVMLSTSVAKLGESIGINKYENGQKEDNNFYVVEPENSLKDMYLKNPDYVAYCKRDVNIVIKSLNAFVDAINQLPTIKHYLKSKKKLNKYAALSKSLTVGGLGRILMHKIYVPYYEQKNYVNLFNTKGLLKIDYETHRFIKNEHNSFYKGGFVQYNPEYLTNHETKWLKDGIKIDVVSAYPYQMTFSMPYGKIYDFNEWENFKKEHDDIKWEHGVNFQEWLIIKIKKSTPKKIAKYCCNINNWVKAYDDKNNKYRYNPNEQKNYVAYLSRQEWDELQHWSHFEIDDIEYYYQLSAPFLKNYAEEVITMKTKFGLLKQGGFKQAMKILANSAYGSLGIRMQFDTLIQASNTAYDFLQDKRDMWVEVLDFNKKNNYNLIKYKGDSLSKSYLNTKAIRFVEDINKNKQYFNICCAALITSLQRVYIWKTIRYIGPKYFVYSDTDSIIFANFSKKIREKIEKICGTNLGQWEIEKRYLKGFTCRKAKDYAVVYVDKDGNEKIETKNAGFKEDTDLKELLVSFFYDDGTEYELDEINVKLGSTTRVKYKSGIIIADIDKINKKTSL